MILMFHASLQRLSALNLNGLADLSLSRMEEHLKLHFLKKWKQTHHLSRIFSKQTQHVGKDNVKTGYKTLTQCYLVLSTA